MVQYIDLHVHSTYSDGRYSVKDLVEKSIDIGLKGISITDHDNINSVYEAKRLARGRIITIPGVEISCYEPNFNEVHILGYNFKKNPSNIKKLINVASKERMKQKKKIVGNLKDRGYDISFEEVVREAKGEIGRPHIARVIVNKYSQEFPSVTSVFEKLIGFGKPAYIPRARTFSIDEAINAINLSDGIPVLAHPGEKRNSKEIKKITSYAISKGIKGIEVFYPYKTNNTLKRDLVNRLAEEYNLIKTGGSDFHSEERGTKINEAKVPADLINPFL